MSYVNIEQNKSSQFDGNKEKKQKNSIKPISVDKFFEFFYVMKM